MPLGFWLTGLVFHSSITLLHDRVEAVVMAACVLHNVLRAQKRVRGEADYEDRVTHVIPGKWREDPPLADNPNFLAGNRSTSSAKDQRNYLRTTSAHPMAVYRGRIPKCKVLGGMGDGHCCTPALGPGPPPELGLL